jgi:hypothetical protein
MRRSRQSDLLGETSLKNAKLFRKRRKPGLPAPPRIVPQAGRNTLPVPPANKDWDALIQSLGRFSDDFMAERDQPKR